MESTGTGYCSANGGCNHQASSLDVSIYPGLYLQLSPPEMMIMPAAKHMCAVQISLYTWIALHCWQP
eukprot:6035607-Pleurochrysis_carterae.AAC.1